MSDRTLLLPAKDSCNLLERNMLCWASRAEPVCASQDRRQRLDLVELWSISSGSPAEGRWRERGWGGGGKEKQRSVIQSVSYFFTLFWEKTQIKGNQYLRKVSKWADRVTRVTRADALLPKKRGIIVLAVGRKLLFFRHFRHTRENRVHPPDHYRAV